MAVASGRADKFVGLHFFNPVQMMKLVEVIKTTHTNEETLKDVSEFGANIGKSVVHCGDTPGFIVNRLLVPFLCQVRASQCCCLVCSLFELPDLF
jgi:3-hydroxyacyl-CoA dehydrogenase